MILKRLELQGYKTFASRTEFIFESGITAIVGPNGSGKSNIADAIRWVLGEQSFGLLRGKRTEDMIFSGTQRRARAGMAQATIVLDNQDGQLPVEFSEVAIGRRAYRSGENEYLLNGSRVRLRDINELLGASGLGRRTYNVIGQGLVDAALSLRAEERRKLFEEAAGISFYKGRRQDTLAKLEATERNLERVEDIVNEIRPRMRRLERQAIRSQEYNQVRKDLENLLYLWYGYHWEVAKHALRDARAGAARQSAALSTTRDKQTALEEQLTSLRQESNQLRAQLGDLYHQNSELHQEAEKLQRNLAVHIERMRLLGQQQEELEADRGSLLSRREQAAKQFEKAERDWASTNSLWQEQQAAVREARSERDRCQSDVNRLRDQEREAQKTLARLESRTVSLRDRQSQLVRRQTQLEAERETTQEISAQKMAELKVARSELDSCRAELDAVTGRLAEHEEKRSALRSDRQRAQAEAKRMFDNSQEARTRLAELEAERRALADVRSRGVGHDAAIQIVMAHRDRPAGIIGPVTQLLRVPAEYEQAIATALGAELSALVVTDQETAQKVITLVQDTDSSGRTSLLPLAQLRPPHPISPLSDGLGSDPDLIGAGSDLVSCDAALQPVVDLLLGRVLLVRDQDAAHRLAPRLPTNSCVVTLDGFLVAQDGRMILPSQKREGGLLTQERAWRALPEKLAAAQTELTRAEESQAAGQAVLDQTDNDLEQIDALSAQQREAQQAVNSKREAAALQVDRLSQSMAWHRERLDELGLQAQQGKQELDALVEEMRQRKDEQAELRSHQKATRAQLAGLPLQELSHEFSARERSLAQTFGARQNQQVIVDTHRTLLQQLESQLATHSQRIEAIAQERERLMSQTGQEREKGRGLAAKIQLVSQQIAPADTRLSAIEVDLDKMLAADQEHRRQVRSAEQAANLAELSLDRAKNELEHLRTRITDELGLVHLPLDEDIEGQTPLPLGELVGQLPIVSDLPPDLEDAIQRRKQQLTRMGAINPNAPAEHSELDKRHRFLTEQTHDLKEADTKLRQVIAELDEVMERDFKRTFTAVAAEFRAAFTRLFGGGSARLILTNPEDPIHSGVEIIARPPERRQQGLALLSGGERSLTAAALIFALLKVSPTPFCVLDEVDAMLDEANVGRFRDMLSELSAETQFIIITHNRGTVQSADTIYGVSMKADGASQIISLRLDGEQLALPEPAPAVA